jgi:DNA repair exonuclease SbcCD ATPase subunit
VTNNKAGKCFEHLLKCTGCAPDGRLAKDDPRVRDRRVAAEATGNVAAVARLVKRARVEGAGALATSGTDAPDTTLALREEIAAKDAQLAASQENNSSLVAKNEELSGRLGSLEEDMQQMRDEMQEMRENARRVEAWRKQVSVAVGFEPPVPSADTFVRKVDDLKQKIRRLETPPRGISIHQAAADVQVQRGLREQIRELEQKLRQRTPSTTVLEKDAKKAVENPRVARHAKALLAVLPQEGSMCAFLNKIIPTADNTFDETSSRSGTKHA